MKKVAIIGCGRISGHHCRSILETKNFKLGAVCDLEIEKAKAYGIEFGIPFFSNYHTMLKEISDIDIVAIITPSGMHYEHAMDIMQNYKKHIIVEKPTFLKLSQVKNAYEVAHNLGLEIFPVFQNRYNKAVQRVKHALEKNEFGKVRLAAVRVRWCRQDSYYNLAPWRGTWALDGGALTNQGIHHLDLLRYLAGEVESVSAQMRTLGASIEVEDTMVAHLTFASGAVGTLEITTAARPDNYEASISLVLEKGLVQLGGIAVNELQNFTLNPSECQIYSEDFSGNVYGNGHKQFYIDIFSHFSNEKKFPVDYKSCFNSIRLLHAIYSSAENNGKVVNVSDELESKNLGKFDRDLFDLYSLN